MSNNDNYNDDLDDDIDFESSDDSDLDDVMDADVEDEDFESEDDETEKVKTKSSLKKYALMGIGLAALAGGTYVLLQQAMPLTDPIPQSTIGADQTIADTLPMPAPISTAEIPAEDMAAPAEAPVAENADVLTPMPAEPLAENAASIPLEPLEVLDAPPVSDTKAGASSEQFQDVTEADIVLDGQSLEESVPDEAGNVPPPQPDTQMIDPVVAEPVSAEIDPIVQDNLPSQISQEVAAPDEVAITEQQQANKALEEKLAQFEKNMNEQISAMQTSVTQKEQEISALRDQIASLEGSLKVKDSEIETLKSRPAAKDVRTSQQLQPENSPPAEQSPALISKSEIVAKKPEIRKLLKSDNTKKQAEEKSFSEPLPLWELRSAQPGKASVGIKGSGDLQDVEIGDVLQGLGKITAITRQNGRWVVQGTNGVISQ